MIRRSTASYSLHGTMPSARTGFHSTLPVQAALAELDRAFAPLCFLAKHSRSPSDYSHSSPIAMPLFTSNSPTNRFARTADFGAAQSFVAILIDSAWPNLGKMLLRCPANRICALRIPPLWLPPSVQLRPSAMANASKRRISPNRSILTAFFISLKTSESNGVQHSGMASFNDSCCSCHLRTEPLLSPSFKCSPFPSTCPTLLDGIHASPRIRM